MVRILVISDTPDAKYWDFYENGKLDEFDLIVSCGDLPPQYLEFLVTFTSAPLLYVRGNHDDCYKDTPPGGCECIEDKIYTFKGIRFLGLGGSMRYKPGDNQFTEKEMVKRISKLKYKLWKSKGFDVLLTHNAIRHFHDAEDLPHLGYECFGELLEKFKPKYMIHGHVHMNYSRKQPRIDTYKETTVINGYKSYILEIDEEKLSQ